MRLDPEVVADILFIPQPQGINIAKMAQKCSITILHFTQYQETCLSPRPCVCPAVRARAGARQGSFACDQ